MPGMSGPQLQGCLAERAISLPIIFMTGYGTIPLAVGAIQAGAMAFLEKPFENDTLLKQIQLAFELDRNTRSLNAEHADFRQKLAALTVRESQITNLLIDGGANKDIARTLGISPRTVEVHRAAILKKLGAKSVTEIVRLTLQVNGTDRHA